MQQKIDFSDKFLYLQQYVLWEDRYQIVKLLNEGFNINYISNEGNNILHKLAYNVSSKPSMFRYLLSLGVNPNCQNSRDSTPLHIILLRNDTSEDLLYMINMFCEYGANINLTDINGNNILMLAVKYRNKYIIEDLIKRGSDLERKDIEGNNLLMLALKNNNRNESIISTLTKYIPDEILKDINNKGETIYDISLRMSNYDLLPRKIMVRNNTEEII